MNDKVRNLIAAMCALALIGIGLDQAGVFDSLKRTAHTKAQAVTSAAASRDSDAPTTAAPKPETTAPATPADPEPAPKATAPDDLYDAGALNVVLRQFVDELGYDPKFTEIVVSSEYAQFSIQDQHAPRKVVDYEWRGGDISGPTPTLIPPRGALRPYLFTAHDFNVNALPALRERALSMKQLGSPMMSTTIIERFLPFDSGIRFLANVSGSTRSAQLRADARGHYLQTV